MRRSIARALVLCVVVTTAVVGAREMGVVAQGPDGGGELPTGAAPGHRANANTPLLALTPGVVLSAQGGSIVGAHVVIHDGAGVADDDTTDGFGLFTVVTKPDARYTLTVEGTSVVGVPFEPGKPLVIVVP